MFAFILASTGGAGFVIGVIYSRWNQLPQTRELGIYRTWLWRSDINERPFNKPGTEFRYSLDGKKNIYRAKVEPDGSVTPLEKETGPFAYLEGPPAEVS